MSRIDGFNPNQGIQRIKNSQQKDQNIEKSTQQTEENAKTNFLSGEEILSFLANTSGSVERSESGKKSKTVDPSKYVNEAQAKRIAFSARQAISALLEFEEAAIKEGFPKDMAPSIAVTTFENLYMPDLAQA